ncbi:hypothetical protein [Syntrophaceticus schinkii]|uniref:Uncharacterized protein n=1 Tax=Syntrophaceticus schinkii TaxID=499207 RepID=A0A0B7MEB0_9FIRM|nr:hypothetical protein [Syntrophaceticus schinkii]CEO88400.1 hypothetical protein SSCH_1810003 [Syntrophaceticus schinkii]
MLQEEITAVLNEVIASGQFILGEHVKSVKKQIYVEQNTGSVLGMAVMPSTWHCSPVVSDLVMR